MVILNYFIAGMLFATIISPLIDAVATVLITGLEVIKGKWTLKITEYNYQIQKLGDEDDDKPKMKPIGFSAPKEEDDNEED